MTLRLLLDMNLSLRLAAELQAEGYDCVHVVERGAGAASDTDIAAIARQERRCLVTADLDFADLAALSRSIDPSVLILRLRDTRPALMLARITVALSRCTEPLTSGAIVIVEEHRLRVRRLPLID
jgi:predicted nuclease of predicted toxin-antitoxin system